MSCIKFPSSKNELTKSSNKENIDDQTLSSSHLISTANQFFGQNNWSHAITNQTLDFIEYVQGKYHAGCISIVKVVQLNNGIFHEDMGYTNSEGSSKGSTIHKARLGSYNNAFKKALMSFGVDVNKTNRPSSRPTSPVTSELVFNNASQIEKNILSSAAMDKNNVEEPFAESIPMSQTDELMDIVDLDQIIAKDQNLNIINSNKVVKVVPKSSTQKDQGEKSDSINVAKINTKVDIPKPNSQIVGNNLIDANSKLSTSSTSKQEIKPDVPKVTVSTAMTEEEMRLERKRKQREMQEQFKRQEEFKRKHVDNGSKPPPPNPRY